MTVAHPVLIVEDDNEIRESLLEILSDAGYRAFAVPNGHEALALLRSLDPRPCLILLDLMMPIMDGATFREKQLEDPALAGIPVVLISASRDVAQTARELNAYQHMSKPLDLDELLVVTRQVCPDGAAA